MDRHLEAWLTIEEEDAASDTRATYTLTLDQCMAFLRGEIRADIVSADTQLRLVEKTHGIKLG